METQIIYIETENKPLFKTHMIGPSTKNSLCSTIYVIFTYGERETPQFHCALCVFTVRSKNQFTPSYIFL